MGLHYVILLQESQVSAGFHHGDLILGISKGFRLTTKEVT